MSALATKLVLELVAARGNKAAHLAVLEHCLNSVRDEAEYQDLRKACAKGIGCTDERLTEVLNVISDQSHELRGF